MSMEALRLVIIDDEPLAVDRLAVLLSRFPNVEIVGRANGVVSGRAAIEKTSPDLALVDVQMRDGTGLDLVRSLPERNQLMVAFTTAFPRYACDAFDYEALDYLLKPVERERLGMLLQKARRRRELVEAQDRACNLERVLDTLRSADKEETSAFQKEIWVRQRGTGHVRVVVDDIDWIDAQDDYACIHVNGREHLLRTSLDKLSQRLDPAKFVRIHRSVIVRDEMVANVRTKSTGAREAVLKDGKVLPIGRIYARGLPWREGERPCAVRY